VLEASKSREQCCEASGTTGTVAARCSTRRLKKSSQQGRSVTASSLLAFLASDDLQNKKQRHKQLVLAFYYFVFQTCFSVSFVFQICG
jgi:hypothetical protein